MENRYESLKNSIYILYSKEGRSISYISRLLGLSRKTLSRKIGEWGFPEAEPRRHFKPSTRKFVNRNRQRIIARLKQDISISDIARELNVPRDFLQRTVIPNDPAIKQVHDEYINRMNNRAQDRRNKLIQESSRNYIQEDLPGEEWKPILGYDRYMVSNLGRVKAKAERYDAWYEVAQTKNANSGRLYVRLSGKKGKSARQNLQVARLVAHAFVPGYDSEHNTVNHISGDVTDNRACNLEWSSQSENNAHAYRELHRKIVRKNKSDFKEIIYKGKYSFTTVAAFARFIGKSETQTRRYLEHPEKHEIRIIR